MNDTNHHHRLVQLLRSQRWGALATADASALPMASMVGYVTGGDASVVYLHLSRLAAHTTNLLANPQAALVVSEADDGAGDPQQLARLTLQGQTQVVTRDSAEYGAARERYLQRLPAAARLFDFPDFLLFRLDVASARFVGGFAQARTLGAAALRALDLGAEPTAPPHD